MPTHYLIKIVLPPHKFISFPKNSSSNSIINNLNKLDIKTTALASKVICKLVHSSPQRNIFSDAWRWLVVWVFGCYGISTIVGYLIPNPL